MKYNPLKKFTVMWGYMDENDEPYTATSIVNCNDEEEAKKIVKRVHPKATFFQVRNGRLGFEYEELYPHSRPDEY